MSRQANTPKSAQQPCSSLIDEIDMLVGELIELDNDEKSKCEDILAKHVGRIRNAIPSKPEHIQYPRPMHRILSIPPLKRIEMPLDVLDVLVSSGFDVNEHDEGEDLQPWSMFSQAEKRITCLHIAVENHHYNAVRWLVQHGADCNKTSYNRSPSIVPITMLASNRDALLDLFDKLTTPKNLNYYEYSPLHAAVQHGNINIAQYLIELGASVNFMAGKTLPLHIAVEQGHTELALLLIKHGASINLEDADHELPVLHIAAKYGHLGLALSLIEHGASVNQETRSGYLPLHLAAEHGHIELAISLVKHGASVNKEGKYRKVPLCIAVEHGHTELALSLAKNGASVNQKSGYRDLPLHMAVKHGHTELALSLIKNGASVNQKSEHRDPLLHMAVKHGHTKLALSLVKNGASVNQKNRDRDLPLHIAVKHGHTELALSLVKNGASVNQKSGYRDRDLPLYTAVKHGHTELALSLVMNGASVNQKNGYGDLPLRIAVEHGHTEFALSMVKNGASVNQKSGYGDLPLHTAVRHGHTELVLLLIKHGSSENHRNRYGCLPITEYITKVTYYGKHFHYGIFTKLIPGRNMDILETICQLFVERKPSDTGKDLKLEILSSMLHSLIQHLVLLEPLSIMIRDDSLSDWRDKSLTFYLHLHPGKSLVSTNFGHTDSIEMMMKPVYLCSVLVILMGCDVSFDELQLPSLGTPATNAEYLMHAYALDALWNTYTQMTGVRKLQALCIQKTRQSMHSLTDESFQSLPVPPQLQNMLKLQDIADVLFEGYQMWPKCMSIEECIHLSM